MIYVDTNVFVYPTIYDEKVEKKASAAKQILMKIAEGRLKSATASLTWDELVWIIRKVFGAKIAVEEGEKFLKFPNLRILAVDEKVIKEAQKLIKKYNLKPRDAIHAACALKNGIKRILSDDPDFDRVKEIKRVELTKA